MSEHNKRSYPGERAEQLKALVKSMVLEEAVRGAVQYGTVSPIVATLFSTQIFSRIHERLKAGESLESLHPLFRSLGFDYEEFYDSILALHAPVSEARKSVAGLNKFFQMIGVMESKSRSWEEKLSKIDDNIVATAVRSYRKVNG